MQETNSSIFLKSQTYLVKSIAIILVTAARLRSLKRSFKAFYFLSALLVFNINGLQMSPTLQLIKPAAQASYSSCFSRSFTKLTGLIFRYKLVKPKSTYFSLIDLSIGRGCSGLLRTYLIFLGRRQFYTLILNISQSSYLRSFQIEAQAVRSLLILAVVYSRQSIGLIKITLLDQFPLQGVQVFDLIYSLASIGSSNKLLLIPY